MIEPNDPPVYSFGEVVAYPNRLQVLRNGVLTGLEPKALRVLFYLIENRARVVLKEELIREVWDGAFVTDNALTRVVAQIRRELGDNARAPRYIQTSATAGYRFVAELRRPVEDKAKEAAVPAEAVSHAGGSFLKRAVITRIAAGLISLLAVAVILWRVRPQPDHAPQLASLRQITTSMALDRWPSFSPDGSQLAFTSDRTGRYQIYTRSVAPGSTDRQITFDDQENIQPTWSPKGDYIAYASVKRGITIVPASGGPLRYCTDFGDSPQWSPDGQWIVFRDTGERRNPSQDPIDVPDATLWLVNAERGAPVHLTSADSPPGGHENPRWLSDSQHVVFETAILIPPTTARPEFIPAVIDIHSRKWTTIPFSPLRARNPIISPDRKYLYFEVRFGERPGLWRARIDSHFKAQSPETVLPMNGPLLRDLAFNATGTLLAFSHSIDEDALWSLPLLGNGSPAGEPKPLLREHVRLLTQPTFSPDGSKIAYTWIQRDSEWVRMSVYVANADGSSATPLTAADQHGFSPSWIGPKTVGYQVTENNLGSYWVKPLNGAPQQTSLQFDWTNSDDVRVRGTKAVAVLSTSSGKQVVVADLDGGPPVVLTPTSRSITEPCWSQDGRWIAAQELVHGNSNLVVFPSIGG